MQNTCLGTEETLAAGALEPGSGDGSYKVVWEGGATPTRYNTARTPIELTDTTLSEVGASRPTLSGSGADSEVQAFLSRCAEVGELALSIVTS